MKTQYFCAFKITAVTCCFLRVYCSVKPVIDGKTCCRFVCKNKPKDASLAYLSFEIINLINSLNKDKTLTKVSFLEGNKESEFSLQAGPSLKLLRTLMKIAMWCRLSNVRLRSHERIKACVVKGDRTRSIGLI